MQQITVSIKIVIFGVIADELAICVNEKSLPSVSLQSGRVLDSQVEELFSRATGLSLGSKYYEQLYTFATEETAVSIVYYALVPLTQKQNFGLLWQKVRSVTLEKEDKAMLTYAMQRLQWKIEYTNVVYSLLPKEFTLSELQNTYEAILEQTLDKRNFRKKILSLNFLEPTGKRRRGVSRPAQVYTFKKRTPTFVKIFS